jgi:hypothetical protein
VSAAPARAELIEDGGAAASDAEFFRTPQFLAAEGTTHTLRIETADGAELRAPLVVRRINSTDPELDATSPYGFPGLAGPDGLVLDPAEIDFSATGLVSVFLRHRLGPSPLAGATPRNVVLVADPELPRKSRPTDRRQIRRNRERGYGFELVPGPQTTPAQRATFVDLYEQTMRRTDASRRYFFDPTYYDALLAAERTWLAIAIDPKGEPAAASIAAIGDGYLHYYLSGSGDARLSD